jgi:transposase
MFYSGIDLHKNNCFITTIDKDGLIVRQAKLPNEEHVILNFFFSTGNIHKAVVESTSNWYWLSDLLKNHQIDLTLAQLLRMNLIPTAHQISPDIRAIRDTMRARLRLVQKKTSSILSIHRILEKFNVPIPENRKLQFISTLPHLKELPLSDEYQFQVDCCCDQIRLLHKQIKLLEKSLHPQLIPNKDIQRLLWIPGIGKISAFTIYLEVDGIERFPDVKKFFSYCRLVPGASNSNQRNKHKSGNKDGNRYLKIAFTEVAVRAVQYYKEVKQFYQRKVRTTNKPIAKTIVAKELARITYHVLKDQTEFKTFKGMTLSREKTLQWPRLPSPAA